MEVYFVRHAQPDRAVADDRARGLSPQGLADRARVTAFLRGRGIGAVLSSPYARAVETLAPFAAEAGLPIHLVEALRERRVGSGKLTSFGAFERRQWEDFAYRLPDGESLGEVQARCVRALEEALAAYAGLNVAVGTHGTALGTILAHYDPSFGYDAFAAMRGRMPWVVRLTFAGRRCLAIRPYDLPQGGEDP